MMSITHRIAEELSVRPAQVEAAIALLDAGNTVPFIARYRKEATGELDDGHLRKLEERLSYLRELDERRLAIRASISEQGKMTDALDAALALAETKARLEDLYLPFKPKRRTKAQIAREAGLEPLADQLLADPTKAPEEAAAAYLDSEKGVADVKAALDGARQILMERFSEDAELLGGLREMLWSDGIVVASVVDGQQAAGAKFSDYFDFKEAIAKIPSHRALALLRGRNEGALQVKLVAADEMDVTSGAPSGAERRIAARTGISDKGRPADPWLLDTVRWTWRVKLHLHLELELMGKLRESAEAEAISVFARNLSALLLAAPAGGRPTLGLDPGVRTGVKVAMIDRTGKVVETATVYPHQPRNDWDGTIATLAAIAGRHGAELVSIGNGTASRETEKLVRDLMKRHPDLKLAPVVVSEAGASVYSASESAAEEFPDLDVTIRGAVSIARRLQDPLAELVKIDPKSIGVGQYQHDVNQQQLGRSLDAVVEDCVNGVGVDVNTASAPLLARVAGLSQTLARNIVAFRDRNGPYRRRETLREVERLGPKAYEQAAGFLRIPAGEDPLDASAVHPESYPLVQRIVQRSGRPVAAVIGDRNFLRSLDPSEFVDDRFGLPTVTDIIAELEKPGRDPRPEFRTAQFQEGVEKLTDLTPGMLLEGVVTNVTNFGAFVDIGVHQDGLVHISMLADRFVKDPHSVVKAGDVVRVKVMEVDAPRKRIGLTMRLGEPAQRPVKEQGAGVSRQQEARNREQVRPQRNREERRPAQKPQLQSSAAARPTPPSQVERPAPSGAMAEAFAKARKR
jgi:uncharacterized protein